MGNVAPIFHTAADGEREEALARRIETAWKCRMWRLPPHSPVDYLATDPRGVLAALVELKCRKCAADTYPSLMVNASKVLTMVDWAHKLGLAAVVVAAYSDGDRWVALNRDRYTAELGRRPGEPIKPVIYLDGLVPL